MSEITNEEIVKAAAENANMFKDKHRRFLKGIM